MGYGAENSGCDSLLKFASATQVGHMHGHSTVHYGAHRAIDGSTGTRQGVASGKWTGDLGSVQDLTELTIQWEACQCANKGSILIDVSADNRHWSRFATEGGWHQWGGRVTRTVRGHAKARYVRITGVTHLMRNSWFSMWEVTAKGSRMPPRSRPVFALLLCRAAGWHTVTATRHRARPGTVISVW